MSIVRIGLAEKKKYADGYDAIFGKKGAKKLAAKPPAPTIKKPTAKKSSKKK